MGTAPSTMRMYSPAEVFAVARRWSIAFAPNSAMMVSANSIRKAGRAAPTNGDPAPADRSSSSYSPCTRPLRARGSESARQFGSSGLDGSAVLS